ncbi:hypothetical protein N7478_012776 [Penicillium angulare]|uniref:uncharacterized protein n=1 Tax=Penicillium angulare TaxID=116970 RepID=UPI00253F9503|nr:uncharacterized protein N7478_012776 [Penicillium angulare]KAJ5256672.1 hypothetical protein N7478_012776 [Penicillium angulare]
MRLDHSIGHDDEYGFQQNPTVDLWDDASQYAPTPGNFCRSPASLSDIGYSNVDPAPSIDYAPPQQTSLPKNTLPLLQFSDWEEGRTYDEDPPTCIHYLIEWKVTLNNRTVAKNTEQDLVLAPRFYWRLFLEPKLKELIMRKYSHRKVQTDDTSVVVSATRQRGIPLSFDGTNIDWASIEKQLTDWGDLFLTGKKLRLVISFNYIDSQSSTAGRRTTDKRGSSSATQHMLRERDEQLCVEEEISGEPPAWKAVYALIRCPGSCEFGPHCWQDPYGKKHYKLYRDQLENLVKYVQSGGVLQSHEDVPGMIREQIYRAERQRLERPRSHNRTASETSCPPITITNVLPPQTPQATALYTSLPPENSTMSPLADLPVLHISGLLDVAVKEYGTWQQSRLSDKILKAEVRKVCEVALDDGLDLS